MDFLGMKCPKCEQTTGLDFQQLTVTPVTMSVMAVCQTQGCGWESGKISMKLTKHDQDELWYSTRFVDKLLNEAIKPTKK